MKKVITTSIVLALMTAMSCRRVENNTDIQTIDAFDIIDAPKTPDFEINTLVKEVKVVPLIAADGTPLPSLSVAGITNDGRVVLNSDSGDIYSANMDSGEILTSFNRLGRASNEFVQKGNVEIFGNEVYVSDIGGGSLRIQCYDLEGNHLRTIANDSIGSFGTYMLEKNRLIVYGDVRKNIGKETSYFALYDTDFNLIGEFAPYCISQTVGAISLTKPSEYNGGYLLQPIDLINNDTLYWYHNDVIEPKFVRTFGNRNIKTEIIDQGGWTSYEREISISSYGGYKDLFFGLVLTKDDGNDLCFITQHNKPIAISSIDYHKGIYGFKCRLDNGKEINIYSGITDGKIINIFDGYELEGVVDGITEDSNPVMIILTLK